jgi:hypothetical protein
MQMVFVVLDVPPNKLGMVKTVFAHLVMQGMEIADYAHLLHFLIHFVQAASVLIQIKFLQLINFLA